MSPAARREEKRMFSQAIYIESPDFKSPHMFSSLHIQYRIHHQVFPKGGEFYYTDHKCLDGSYFSLKLQ